MPGTGSEAGQPDRFGRFAGLDQRPVNLDGFAAEDHEAGMVAFASVNDPAPSVRVADDGRITELDGTPEAGFDLIDAFVAAHGVDGSIAEEAGALDDVEFARRIVDPNVPRAEVVRLAAGATPAKLAHVVALLRPVELQMAIAKMRVRRTPSSQAHVTNLLDDPLLLAADAATAVAFGFREIETTVPVNADAPSNALAVLIGSQVGAAGTLTQCSIEEAMELELGLRGLTTYAETVSVYGTEKAFVDGDDTPWSKAFLCAAYASRGLKMRVTSGGGAEALMGAAEGKSLFHLESRCVAMARAMGAQGVQNGGIDGASVVGAVPDGMRELLAENLLVMLRDLESCSGNDALVSESDMRRTAHTVPLFLAGSDFLFSGFGSIVRYDNMFGPSNFNGEDLDDFLVLQRDWGVDGALRPVAQERLRAVRERATRACLAVYRELELIEPLAGDDEHAGPSLAGDDEHAGPSLAGDDEHAAPSLAGDVEHTGPPAASAAPAWPAGFTDDRIPEIVNAEGSKDITRPDPALVLGAADAIMRRQTGILDVVRALWATGYEEEAGRVFAMGRARVAGEYLQTAAIFDEDMHVLSKVTDPNDYQGPGTGYGVSRERREQMAGIRQQRSRRDLLAQHAAWAEAVGRAAEAAGAAVATGGAAPGGAAPAGAEAGRPTTPPGRGITAGITPGTIGTTDGTERGTTPARDTTSPVPIPFTLVERGEAQDGTHPREVCVGVSPAFATSLWLTMSGLPATEALRQIVAGIEEEGGIARIVRVPSTVDLGVIGLTAAQLAGSGIGVGLQAKGTALIHRRDLQPLACIELLSIAPLLTPEMYRALGVNAARHAKGQRPAPVRNPYTEQAIEARYHADVVALVAIEREACVQGAPPVELEVQP
jgi:propanediol dehydratase large subunit